MFEWNPKKIILNINCYVPRAAPKALKTFLLLLMWLLKWRGWERWGRFFCVWEEWERKFCAPSRGRKTTFSSFSMQSYRHIHMKQSLPTLSSLCICPGCCAAVVVGGMGLYTKCHARSWISVLGISSACYCVYELIYVKHKNLWKRWQHHPIFCVYGTF